MCSLAHAGESCGVSVEKRVSVVVAPSVPAIPTLVIPWLLARVYSAGSSLSVFPIGKVPITGPLERYNVLYLLALQCFVVVVEAVLAEWRRVQ